MKAYNGIFTLLQYLSLDYTATLHRFTQHNRRFTKNKFFISLKAILVLKKILDWDTNKCCYKDIAKYPEPEQVPNQEMMEFQ